MSALIILPATVAIVLSVSTSVMAEPPKFEKFGVSTVYRGKTIFPQFNGRDRANKDFKTRIREGMKNGPNFAGSFSVIEVGCGASCRNDFIANNKTGEVFKFPRGGEDNLNLQLDFKLSSRLILAQWVDESAFCRLEYFEWNGSEARLLGKEQIGPEQACYEDIGINLVDRAAAFAGPPGVEVPASSVADDEYLRTKAPPIQFEIADTWVRDKNENPVGVVIYKQFIKVVGKDDYSEFAYICPREATPYLQFDIPETIETRSYSKDHIYREQKLVINNMLLYGNIEKGTFYIDRTATASLAFDTAFSDKNHQVIWSFGEAYETFIFIKTLNLPFDTENLPEFIEVLNFIDMVADCELFN